LPQKSSADKRSVQTTYGVGEPHKAPAAQPGSWAYAILPFLEQRAAYEQRRWDTGMPLYTCPSRRGAEPRIPVPDEYGSYQGGGWAWAHTDYGGNGKLIANRPACQGMNAIADGTSQTILIGEKAMHPKNYNSGTWYWDEPYFVGGSGGTQRGFGSQPGEGTTLVPDSPQMGNLFRYNWGAAHAAGVHFLFTDGSVRLIAYGISQERVQGLLTPAGGEAIGDF
jgi:hypothetical protein